MSVSYLLQIINELFLVTFKFAWRAINRFASTTPFFLDRGEASCENSFADKSH
jgi:hypothetical protein